MIRLLSLCSNAIVTIVTYQFKFLIHNLSNLKIVLPTYKYYYCILKNIRIILIIHRKFKLLFYQN